MALGSRHGFGGGGGGGGEKERVRTHMMFSSEASHPSQRKKSRRKRGKFGGSKHIQLLSQDVMVQTSANPPTPVTDIESWTGNQRVVHFGPLANRDPFYYYYPKGWDVLYPAHFGFFPYRNKKFRGSSPTVCLGAFGVFLLLGGCLMVGVGWWISNPLPPPFSPRFSFQESFSHGLSPLQVAGPVCVVFGSVLMMLGACWWCCTLRLCSERLRHSQPHYRPPRRVHVQKALTPVKPRRTESLGRHHPLYPPPPGYPVFVNAHTQPSLYSPEQEMKLYPPVMPGYSTHSLCHSYPGSPYNTLSSRPEPHTRSPVLENVSESTAWPEYHAAKISHQFPSSKQT